MKHWQQKAQDQGRFAHVGTIDLGKVILRYGSSSLQATFLHIATNSIHQYWQDDPLAHSGQSVQALKCASCNHIMSIDHLGVCNQPTAIHFRVQLMKDVVNVLTAIASSDGRRLLTDWSSQDLEHFMVMVCPILSLPPHGISYLTHRHDHYIRCMIGAFAEIESNSIIRKLNRSLPSRLDESSLIAMRLVRITCLESINTLFNSLKI